MTLMPVSNISVRRREVLRARGLLVDAAALDVGGQLRAEVDRLAEQVEDAPERRLADGHRDRPAGVDHLDAAREAVGGVHRDGAHAIVAEVLLHLADQHAHRRRLRCPRPPPPPQRLGGRR